MMGFWELEPPVDLKCNSILAVLCGLESPIDVKGSRVLTGLWGYNPS